jgi:hypothetical protein
MKTLVLTLRDGDHILSTPTFATISLMEDNGIDLAAGVNMGSAKVVCGILAAMLTASEPMTDGRFSRVWTHEEAGLLIDASSMPRIVEVVAALFADAYPEPSGAESPPSPKRRPRAVKP